MPANGNQEKADSAPPEVCAIGGSLVGLVEGPALFTTDLNSVFILKLACCYCVSNLVVLRLVCI